MEATPERGAKKVSSGESTRKRAPPFKIDEIINNLAAHWSIVLKPPGQI